MALPLIAWLSLNAMQRMALTSLALEIADTVEIGDQPRRRSGGHPSSARVLVLEACQFGAEEMRPSQPKCAIASSGLATTGTLRPRPMTVAMSPVRTPCSATP